jgi:hypothetical protein
MHLYPFKTIMVRELYSAGHDARLNFVNWYLHSVNNGKMTLKANLFSDDPWFHLSDTNSQYIHAVPLSDSEACLNMS